MVISRLRDVLKERGLRQDWVAEKANVHPTTLSKLAQGKAMPTLEVAYRIANLLDLRIDEIWVWEEDDE